MSFGLTFDKLIIIGIIALVLIGPERLPRYAEQLARWVRTWRATLTTTRARLAEELGEPATGGWNPSEAETPRAPKPDFDKPRPPKVSKAPPNKDKGKPKWASKAADGALAAKKVKPTKDHKPKRKPQI